MLIGYVRSPTPEQNLRTKGYALQAACCAEIYTDIARDIKVERPGLTSALSYLRKGDTLVLWRLDRLGHSLDNLIPIFKELSENELGFKCLQERIDTTTSGGRLPDTAYTNATEHTIALEYLSVGQSCPHHYGEKLYSINLGILINIKEQNLASVDKYWIEKLRCALCNEAL